jgi:hypothetical protein
MWYVHGNGCRHTYKQRILNSAGRYLKRPWRLSWILQRNTASPHYDTALKTWKRNVRLLTASKRFAVADSSTLVILTKLDCLDFLNRVFPRVYISIEVSRGHCPRDNAIWSRSE